MRVGVVEGKQETREAVDVLVHDRHGQVLLGDPNTRVHRRTHRRELAVFYTLAPPTLVSQPIRGLV